MANFTQYAKSYYQFNGTLYVTQPCTAINSFKNYSHKIFGGTIMVEVHKTVHFATGWQILCHSSDYYNKQCEKFTITLRLLRISIHISDFIAHFV